MPSGYENSDDYGGPEPGWSGMRAVVLLVALMVVAALVVRQWQ
jgi:hypothetical protein